MHDTVIIGAGIAGLTAAVYASRKNMDFRIISSDFGGQFMVSGEVLNYPGIVKTTGVEFSMKMEEQMKFNNVKIDIETVKEVKREGDNFKVVTDKGEHETRTVIIASGARARKIGIRGEDEFAKKGLTYCSVCDGPLFSGKNVVIVGGGNSALEAVDFMKNIASKIYMLVLGDSFTGHEYLIENVKNNPKVEVIFGASVTGVTGDKFVTGITYERGGEEKHLDVDGVIIEIGRVPNTDVFEGFIEFDDHKHIKIDCQTRTSVPGVFAAGDCASGHEYQYVIAAGQGCMALLKAARYLANKKDK